MTGEVQIRAMIELLERLNAAMERIGDEDALDAIRANSEFIEKLRARLGKGERQQ
jgi:hypothetical protein